MYLCEYEKCCFSTFMGELANIIPELRTKFRTKIRFSRKNFFLPNRLCRICFQLCLVEFALGSGICRGKEINKIVAKKKQNFYKMILFSNKIFNDNCNLKALLSFIRKAEGFADILSCKD